MRSPASWFCYCREAVMVLDTNVANDATDNGKERWTDRPRTRPQSVPPHLLNGPTERNETAEMISRLAVEASSPILSTRVLSIVTPSVDVSVNTTKCSESPTDVTKSVDEATTCSPSERTVIEPETVSRSASARSTSRTKVNIDSAYKSSDDEDEEDESDDEEEEDSDSEKASTVRDDSSSPTLDPCETDFGRIENLPDPLCFDFDASSSIPPVFNYPYALPSKFSGTDFRRLAEGGHTWRQLEGVSERHFSDADRAVLDRICDFERLQLATEQQELNRRDQLRRAFRDQQDQVRRLRAQGATPGRIASATGRQLSRQCCATCLQPACVGDCPSKSARPKVCVLCRQPYCEGTCAATSYEEHQRDVDAQGDRSNALRSRSGASVRPTSCGTCRSPVLASSQRLLNANAVVLGRPDCHRATFAVGRAAKRPPDLRPAAPDAHLRDNRAPYRHLSTMISKFEALGMSPTAPPLRNQRRRPRPKGRSAVEPGKSRQSCRRNSLTIAGSTDTSGTS